MARVVGQRGTPPYLLIFMVFLFLIAATLAVLGYIRADKEAGERTTEQEARAKLASSEDLRNATVQRMLAAYDNPPSGEGRKSVVAQLLGQVQTLSGYISTAQTDGKVAAGAAAATLDAIGSRRGLAEEASQLYRQLTDAQDQLTQQQTQIAGLRSQLDNKDALVAEVSTDLQGNVDQLHSRVDDLDQKAAESHKGHQDELNQARQEWDNRRESLSQTIATRNQEIQRLQTENAQLTSTVRQLKNEIRKKADPGTDPEKSAYQSDGKILQVLPSENLCYIDLGSKDRVTPGLTFTVYSASGIPKDGKGKAVAVVSNIGDHTSECRLVDQIGGDPVVAGDLVANLAFDSTRVYSFVVVGKFDLYGTGKATIEGTDEAKMLIRRFGGKVVDAVSVNTDFIILGDQPAAPVEPAGSSSPQQLEVYRQQLKVAERYDSITAMARSMQIPMLNTNRFLAFIGYRPTKAGR